MALPLCISDLLSGKTARAEIEGARAWQQQGGHRWRRDAIY